MKTLSAAIIAGMDGDSDRVILVRIIPESGDTWAELCWATKDITVLDWEGGGASKSFAGDVLAKGKMGTIRQSVDIEQGGNVATVSGLTITIRNAQYNGEDRFDQIFTGDLENRRVEIRRVFWTGSSPSWSDTLLLYEGMVEDIDYDHETYRIKVRDAGFKRHKAIPDLTLSKDDYTVIPVYNRGKTVPLTYGDLTVGDARISTLNMVPVIRVNKGKEQFVIARNKVDDFTPAVYLYFSGVNRWVLLTPDSGSFSLTRARPSKLNFPLGTNILGKLETQLETQGSQTFPGALVVKHAIDESWDTVTELDAGIADQLLYLKAPMPPEFGRTIDETYTAKLYIQFGTIPDDGSNGRIKYYNPATDTFSTGQVYDYAQSGDLVSYEITGKTWNELSSYEYGVTCMNGTCEVANMYLVIEDIIVKMTTDKVTLLPSGRGLAFLLARAFISSRAFEAFNELRESDNIALNLKGGEFGSWIDADSRDNGYNEGNLISRPSYIIETILRDELGLTSDEIDYESFDALGNTTDGERKDWPFAIIIDSRDNSLNIIKGICQYVGIIFFQDYQGKEKVVSLKKQTAIKTIDRTTIQGDSVKTGLSDLENVFNEFYLNHDRLWVSGSYGKTLYVTASSNNLSSNSRSGTPNTYTGLCSDSQSKYNTVKRLTMDCDCINDDATAELLIKWLAEWHCYRKRVVKFKSKQEHINLELGDQVKIDHTLLPAGVSDDASFVIFDIKDNLDDDSMAFECMQVPELLP